MGSENQGETKFRYSLSVGSGSLSERLKLLAQDLPQTSVAEARQHVRDYLVRIAKLDDPRYHDNLKGAVWVSEQCHRLLDHFDQLQEQQQKLALAAIRYFIVPLDSVQDYSAVNGFHDDQRVMLHVLEQLNLLPEQFHN